MSRPEPRVLQLCHGYDGPFLDCDVYYRWSWWLFVDRIAPLRHDAETGNARRQRRVANTSLNMFYSSDPQHLIMEDILVIGE